MNNKIFILLGIIMLLPLVFAETNTEDIDDIFKIDQTISYAKTCIFNNTYCSASATCNYTMLYPNKSIFINNVISTNNVINYNVTITPDVAGIYDVNMVCIDAGSFGAASFRFQATTSGEQMNLTKGILYIFFLLLLIFFFIFSVIAAEKTPTSHKVDDFGNILSINNLRHLRPVFYALAWGIMIAIIFIASNVALIFLGDSMIGDLLFKLSTMTIWLTIPAMLLWVMFIFINVFKDKENKKLIERGIDVPFV